MFQALHQFAKTSPLILTIVAEGEQLRVTVTPQLDASKATQASPHPLYILATPEELDADFATAIGIYAPAALTVLEQAEASANANSDKQTKALPAPSAKEGGKGQGRGRRAQKPASEDNAPPAGETDQVDTAGEGDAAQQAPVSSPVPAPETISPPPPAAPAGEVAREEAPSGPTPEAEIDPRQIGLELPI